MLSLLQFHSTAEIHEWKLTIKLTVTCNNTLFVASLTQLVSFRPWDSFETFLFSRLWKKSAQVSRFEQDWLFLHYFATSSVYRITYLKHLFPVGLFLVCAICFACCAFAHSGQRKKLDIQLPSGSVYISFQLPLLKYHSPNRGRMFTP